MHKAHAASNDGRMPAYARPLKESHLDTVRYEIEMLRFCVQRLPALRDRIPHTQLVSSGYVTNMSVHTVTTEPDPRDVYVYLEAFLVHYRNLIRFFSGKRTDKPKDLSVKKPEVWAGRALSPAEDAAIRSPAVQLDTHWHDRISKYLQHCTEVRSERDVEWPIGQMMNELQPILGAFEQAFPKGQ